MSKSQEKRLAIQDASKPTTYKLLCDILALCLELKLHYIVHPETPPFRMTAIHQPYLQILKNNGLGFGQYNFPELETAIIDLKTYKEKHNDRKNKNS